MTSKIILDVAKKHNQNSIATKFGGGGTAP